MEIKDAKYNQIIDGKNIAVEATIDGRLWFVPLEPANRHYAEILRQVKEGTLTIKDAE